MIPLLTLLTMFCCTLAAEDVVVTIINKSPRRITVELPGYEAKRGESQPTDPQPNKLATMQRRLYPGGELKVGSLPKKIKVIDNKKEYQYTTTAAFEKLPELRENIEISYNKGSFSMISTDEQRPPE